MTFPVLQITMPVDVFTDSRCEEHDERADHEKVGRNEVLVGLIIGVISFGHYKGEGTHNALHVVM